ncbi:hypothetical protein VN97_g11442 [Penicillium thymicola]|uniref:Uncharacterized protein n=1 Tax=Penicillium thymicola TaxID=293382 RepID=A0AAI9X306_PENTH|nr:hypothetical protein VN97_g11442 [Penicillium thymicola]
MRLVQISDQAAPSELIPTLSIQRCNLILNQLGLLIVSIASIDPSDPRRPSTRAAKKRQNQQRTSDNQRDSAAHHLRANHARTNHPDRTERSETQPNELQAQNEKLHEEVQALRAQIDGLNAPTATRSWAAVAADTNKSETRENRQQTENEKNCVRISTQQSPDDSPDTENSVNAFGRYCPTPIANTRIRTALMNIAPLTNRRNRYHEDRLRGPVQRRRVGRVGPQQ